MSTSKIQEFYKDQTLFITGGTGFVGTVLVTKLLTSCYNIKKIYLLMREKKGKNADERLRLFLEASCFDLLRREKPNFHEKLAVIHGNCDMPGLNISEKDKKILTDEVTFIIHICATVKFDEELKIAAYTNVRAVRDIIQIAKSVKNLKGFIYVSTAYSNSNQKHKIFEKFYVPPMNPEEFLEMIESKDRETLNTLTSQILGSWPNTYTFTKAIAENVIKEEARDLPVAIFRPSIIMAPVKEPEPGWMGSLQGISALCLAAYIGFTHCQHGSFENIVAIVPLDYVTNSLIAIGYDIQTKTSEIPIYNYTGSNKNKFTWGNLFHNGKLVHYKYPSVYTTWHFFYFFTENDYLFKFYNFCFHKLPAYIADCILFILRKETKFIKLTEKLEKGLKLTSHFTLNSWEFETKNLDSLWNSMNDKDKKLFPFNMDNFEWSSYFEKTCIFVRKQFLKDPMNTVTKAKRKVFILGIAHYLIILLLLYFVYTFLRFIFFSII